MGIIVPKIYIIAPDANTLLMRRLTGYGFASNCHITVVNNTLDLPSNNIDNSYLIAPVEQVKQLKNKNSWRQVYAFSTLNEPPQSEFIAVAQVGHCNYAESLPKILQILESMISSKSQLNPWHAHRSERISDFKLLTEYLKEWSTNFKLKSHPSIQRIQQFMHSIQNFSKNQSAVSPENSVGKIQSKLTILVDGVNCTLTLEFENNGIDLANIDAIRELTLGTWFTQIIAQKNTSRSQIKFKFTVIPQQSTCFYIENNNLQLESEIVSFEKKVS